MMTTALHTIREEQAVHLLRAASEEVQLQTILGEAIHSWKNLQEMAALLHRPSQYLLQEPSWDHWDQRLREQVQLLGVKLFESALRSTQQVIASHPSGQQRQPCEDRSSADWSEPSSLEDPSLTKPEALRSSRPKKVKVTNAILADLNRSMNQRNLEQGVTESRVVGQSAQKAAEKMQQLGAEMASLADDDQDDCLMAVLKQATSCSMVRVTAAMPVEVRLDFFHMAVAFARALQLRRPDECFRAIFGRLRCEMAQVGFVYGMALKDEPKRSTWESDAAHHWRNVKRQLEEYFADDECAINAGTAQRLVEELLQEASNEIQVRHGMQKLLSKGLKPDTRVCRLLAEHLGVFSGRQFKKLRKAINRQTAQDEAEEETNQRVHQATPPEDWPFWELTRGKRAVMIGSQGKKHQLEAVKRAFGFSQLDWVGCSEGKRRVQAINSSTCKRDCVYLVMHRYISHSAADHIWARRDEAVVIGVNRGFSVGAVRLGIEKDGLRYAK